MDQTTDEELSTLISELANICKQKPLRLATAESCTGGGIAYAITTLSGSSDWFERGFVTYSNLAKVEMLGVHQETLNQAGAVSQAVAKEMAEGALRHSHADVSLSVTGVAGPLGGTPDKPVGTCWFGWSSLLFGTHCEQAVFKGDRSQVRYQAICFSLKRLLSHLIAINSSEHF